MRSCRPALSTAPGYRGSGTVSGLAVILATVTLGVSGVAVTAGIVEARSAQTVSNQAALAASDVSRGVVPGHPCRVASSLVTDAGFRLLGCEVKQGSARIVVGGSWWGIGIEKRAHAGPPDHPAFRESQ